MRRLLQRAFLVLAFAAPLVCAMAAHDAGAAAAYESPYTFEQTYSAALRLVRVDFGYKITEKDADSGYLLFEYTSHESGKRVYPGAIEFVKLEGRVLVTVKLPALPQYHERMLTDALAGKLSSEYGEPPKKAKPQPQVDAGTDSGD